MPRMYSVFRTQIHPSRIFYASAWGIIAGIVASLSLKLRIFDNLFWLIMAVSILIFALRHASIVMLMVAFCSGLIIGNYRVLPEILSQNQFAALIGQTVTLRGKITEDPTSSAGQIKLRLGELELVEKPVENSQGYVLALAGNVYIQLANSQTALERSDRIQIQGSVGAGFGVFVATFYRPTLQSVTRPEAGDIFARLKSWFAQQVRNFIASPTVDLGLGYLVGMKSGLPESFSDALSAVGMTHVVVASGAHLGILIGAAKKLFGRLSKFSGLLFSLLLVLGFALTVGFTPSMTRAALVTSLGLLVGYVGRKFTPFRLLSLVAALTLLLTPTNFQNLGWQLSFASFFGIMILAPHFQKFFYGGKKLPWLASILITSISTSLVCAPILIDNFGSLSFLSLVANLIVLPTLPYAMLLVFLTGSFSFCAPLAQFFAQLATHLLDFHIALINFLSEQRMLILELPSGDPRVYLLYLVVLACCLWCRHKEEKLYNKEHED